MVDKISEVINKLLNGHANFIKNATTAREYYLNDNRIKLTGAASYNNKTDKRSPLKVADNRISHNWHELLVRQKVGYLFTYPPAIDIGEASANEKINEILGGKFARVLKNAAVDASNCGTAWVHIWKDKNGDTCYTNVDPVQIIPIYTDNLENELIAVLRAYRYCDENGNFKNRCEYWTDKEVRFYEETTDCVYAPFFYPQCGEVMRHDIGMVPFISFFNNETKTDDLHMYKDLIDAYDKVYSGFENDIDDVQEVIFVLKNYAGQDKSEFIDDLKSSKLVKVDDDGGLDVIRAEIPCEARQVFLDRTRKQIFTSGMGVDPDNEKIGNASGVALKHLYSLLELKCGALETEFRCSIETLVKTICRLNNIPCKTVTQTWSRNAVQNDLENAQIASMSKDVVSDKTIVKNHPWTENAETEIEELEKQQEKQVQAQQQMFGMTNTPPGADE